MHLLTAFVCALVLSSIVFVSSQPANGWTTQAPCDPLADTRCLSGPNSACLVTSQSLNFSSLFNWNAFTANQLYQCRCNNGDAYCNATSNVTAPTQCTIPDGNVTISVTGGGDVVNIFYAAMWRCSNNANIQTCPTAESAYCPPSQLQLLPNVYSLVSYWCQNKPSCQVEFDVVKSYVNPLDDSNPTIPLTGSVFEWRYQSVNKLSRKLGCPKNTVPDLDGQLGDSCFKLTKRGISWEDSRQYCQALGGDLASFSSHSNFYDILYRLGAFATNSDGVFNPIWFKWFTWSGYQRLPEYYDAYLENLQCNIVDPKYEDGKNRLTRCRTASDNVTMYVRGLCVLPPTDGLDRGYKTGSCPAETVIVLQKNVTFPSTVAGTVRLLPCPPGFNGNLTWACNTNNQWNTARPDLTNCTSAILGNPMQDAVAGLNSGLTPAQVLNLQSEKVENVSLVPGDISVMSSVLKLTVEAQWTLMQKDNIKDKETFAKNFTDAAARLTNKSLALTNRFWNFENYDRFRVVGQYQLYMDNTTYQLATHLQNNTYQLDDYENIVVKVEPLRNKSYYNDLNENTTFSIATPSSSLTLPKGFQNAVEDDTISLSFVSFRTVHNLLYGDHIRKWEGDWVQKTRQNANAAVVVESLRNVVNTPLLGATVGLPLESKNLSVIGKPVEISLARFTPSVNKDSDSREALFAVDNIRCVFWDLYRLDWSSEGCTTVSSSLTSTVCQCSHLTNFAILMDINGIFNKNKDRWSALDWITLIGLAISIICLTVSLLIYAIMRNVRKDFRFQIHINLCLCLLAAQVAFVAGVDNFTFNTELCFSVAVILHYFFLCSFGWMLVEGLYLYFLVTDVFEGSGLKPWMYYWIGYAVPAVIVTVTLGATANTPNPHSNNTHLPGAYLSYYAESLPTGPNHQLAYCWLNSNPDENSGAIWAFLAPVAVVILLNSVFLTVAQVVAFKIRRIRKKQGREVNYRWLVGATSLTIILGITWIFGFAYLTEGAIALAYVFAIFNSLQGFVIFLTSIVLNKQVRDEIRKRIAYSTDSTTFFNIRVPVSNRALTSDAVQIVGNRPFAESSSSAQRES